MYKAIWTLNTGELLLYLCKKTTPNTHDGRAMVTQVQELLLRQWQRLQEGRALGAVRKVDCFLNLLVLRV